MKKRTYQFSIGEHRAFVLYDNDHDHSAGDLIAHPDAEELERISDEYALDLNKIPVGYNNLLLRTGDHYVLVDAGIRRPIGELCLGLEELKIDPGVIDTIIITHSDMDHVGGILDQEGGLSFPKARYIMLEDSWQHWCSEERRSELTKLNRWTEEKMHFVWETYAKIRELIQFVNPGEEFLPGIRMFAAPGHRYDHSILKICSSGEQLVHLADALVHPLFMGDRAWYSTYDADPTRAVETKISLLDMCASENSLVFAAHFPFPGLGYARQGQAGWDWQPIDIPSSTNTFQAGE